LFLITFNAVDGYGRVLGFDLEFLINTLFIWFNLAVIILILSWLLYKPIVKFMSDRKERIRAEIENAAENMRLSEVTKAEYEAKLAGIKVEREEILELARKAAGEREITIVANAHIEAGLILERAHKEIEHDLDKAKDEIRNQIIQVSAMMTEQLMGSHMDADLREKILNQSITELGDAPWKN